MTVNWSQQAQKVYGNANAENRMGFVKPPSGLPSSIINLRSDSVRTPVAYSTRTTNNVIQNDPQQPELAYNFACTNAVNYAYTDGLGWMVWDGTWRRSDGEIEEAVREFLNTDLRKYNYGQLQQVLKFAESDPLFRVPQNKWNNDPYALNTPTAIWNLVDGTCVASTPRALVTRTTSVSAIPGDTPMFDALLESAFPNSPEMHRYIWDALSVALTGRQDDHGFNILYGDSGTGKSTIMKIMVGILGTGDTGYASTITSDLLLDTKYQRHREQYARLFGVRLVWADEFPTNATLSDQVKDFTGGGNMVANFMRQNSFEFVKSHTLFVTTNERPGVKDRVGFDRRIREWKFDYKPLGDIIPDLDEKIIKEEGGQILHKLIQRCAAYLSDGFAVPQAVVDNSNESLDASDSIKQFLEHACSFDPTYRIESNELFVAYSNFCKVNGLVVKTENRGFGRALSKHGIDRLKSDGKVYRLGIMPATVYLNM